MLITKQLKKQAEEIILYLTNKFSYWNNELNNHKSHNKFKILNLITREINISHNKLQSVVKQLSNNDRDFIKYFFRKHLNPYWKQGTITKRVIEKPNGYHGDYLTMELMYENKFSGNTKLGQFLHKYVTNDRSSHSVRLRRNYFSKKITAITEATAQCSILSVASGPATEIESIVKNRVSPQKIVLLDQDANALKYSIRKIKNYLSSKTKVITLNQSIIELVRSKHNNPLQDIGPFDYIYSAGLYDYLSNITAKKLTHFLFNNLKENGTLEFGNFSDFSIGFFAEISADWKLILRQRQQLSEFIPKNCNIRYFKLGDQIFASLRR